MGMMAILFNGAEPSEQIVNIPSIVGPIRNLVKIGQVVSEKEKDYTNFYLYIAQGQGQIPRPQGSVCV